MGTIVRPHTVAGRAVHPADIHSEQWRYTGPFTRFNRFKGSFPGLGIATVAFAGYLVAEQLLWKDDHAHHEEGGH